MRINACNKELALAHCMDVKRVLFNLLKFDEMVKLLTKLQTGGILCCTDAPLSLSFVLGFQLALAILHRGFLNLTSTILEQMTLGLSKFVDFSLHRCFAFLLLACPEI